MRVRFFFALAAAGVLLRLFLSDVAFFRLLQIPSHDMSQGLAFFTTSMHSVRLTGDLAWWFPGSFTGYAQYYQGFLSPLAPTYGHIVFIAWAHLVAILATLGIAVPEYYQYLVVNYLVLPLLAFVAFAWFCSRFLRSRAAVALALLAYVLSGVGLWNSAWFYFQEAFSVFFLLGSALALLQRPEPRHALVFLAAVLVQLASLNYWTVYNSFFVAIVLGAYGATQPNQCVRLAVRARSAWRRHRRRATIALAAFGVTALAWTLLIALLLHEQAAAQLRLVYGPEEAIGRMQEMRLYTLDLFNPSVERGATRFTLINDLHSARYIGIALLPLLVLGTLGSMSRRARWLLASAVLVLAVCLGSYFVVYAWRAIPFMDRIQHTFYFYTHYWQLVAILLAAVGLDVLAGSLTARTRRLALGVFGTGIAAAAFTMAAFAANTHEFRTNDPNLQGNLRAALLLALACALLFRVAWNPASREKAFGIAAVLLLTLLDLSAYFQDASRADMAFTARREFPFMAKPNEDQRAALRSPWGPLRPEQGFHGGLEAYMPVGNELWPDNFFIMPRDLNPNVAYVVGAYGRSAPPVAFYDAPVRATEARMPISLAYDPADIDRRLLVADPAAPAAAASNRITEAFAYRMKSLRYNDFHLEVEAPRDGWLMVRQLSDPYWRVMVDGAAVRPLVANYVFMALPLARGRHDLRFEYRPRSRALYWPAAALLAVVVTAFLVLAFRSRRGHS